MEGQNIIVVGLQPWDIEIGSNCKNLAVEFAKKNRVLYVNAPLDRLTMFRDRKSPKIVKRKKIRAGQLPPFEEVAPNLTVFYPRTVLEPVSQLKPDFLFDWLNKRNNKRFAREIKFALKQLAMESPFYIFNDSDMFRSFYLKELLKPKLYVYYTRDNLVAVDYWKKQGIRAEALHMAKADLVVANSAYLARLASAFNPNSRFVGQGCETSAFSIGNHYELPAEIKGLKHPIIGYIGVLKTLRLDIEILLHIARLRPEWTMLLVGPEDETFAQSELHRLPNVVFTGNKRSEELPACLAAFDVALNPQLINEVTIGNYPRKIDEYLAMGKATVATKTEAMGYFAGYTYLAETADEYIALIEKALAEDSDAKRKQRAAFAAAHTWENNANEIYRWISETEKMKNNATGA